MSEQAAAASEWVNVSTSGPSKTTTTVPRPSRRKLPRAVIYPGYRGPDPDAVAFHRMLGARNPVAAARRDEEIYRRAKRLREGGGGEDPRRHHESV